MKKYNNIIFDFGNVLAKFDVKEILTHFCSSTEEFQLMKTALFYDWDALDGGKIDYFDYMRTVKNQLPVSLHQKLEHLSKTWYQHLSPISETWTLIQELKKSGYALYILSNASTYFAEHASFFEITKEFDGIVFSGPLKMAKPNSEIYQYLFHSFQLIPEECLFLDDKKENIDAGIKLGMDGVVFDLSVLPQLRQLLL